MAITDDVFVIGGGLAGATAALAAAERGVQVRLLSYKQSTLRHASGLIDVLGYAPDGQGPLADPFDALESLPVGHPYERVGGDSVREALLFFDAIAGDTYAGEHTDANALVPTSSGAIKPTARYPAGVAPGVASDPSDALLVGFETLPEFDAPLAAAHLEDTGAPFEARGVTLSFPGIRRDDAKVTRYAHLLDRDEAVDIGRGETFARAALAAIVRDQLEGESRVGFPPILGDDNHATVRRDLEERLGVDVFEVPSGPPSLPGMRLEDRLYDALEDAGVRVTTGVPVVDYEGVESGRSGSNSRRIEHVLVDRKGQDVPYRADEYVLATGGLVGKGVRSDRERVFEPIFDCHVEASPDRYDWFDGDAFGDHPFARFGVTVDRELRPLDAEGDLEFANLRAAGAVLSGYDFAAEKSGSGVSLATGFVAGDRAGSEVRG
ncbi:glycerol-3-phosphate dehydrogenase subunit GlpB [Natronosalvus rutilus]|uniref:Glycerol-3-phosphate dehydrogenase subunit GlpB n=1 Tax=Natronosalvus rutilus TaxID=2953753 RepID=A0A9E7SVB4_9EURY|nr:glycerol-3-phosphate dehydrogenase subunit GlpB [Natronosalvus rutilus]UTF52123.1 glycerol-3-phosphate dehydrogenase subunit GlpB [Natronosalvus rutilus]